MIKLRKKKPEETYDKIREAFNASVGQDQHDLRQS